MEGFSRCGFTLPTLHDVLEYYEAQYSPTDTNQLNRYLDPEMLVYPYETFIPDQDIYDFTPGKPWFRAAYLLAVEGYSAERRRRR